MMFAFALLSSLFTLIPVYAESSGDLWSAIKSALSDAEKAESEQGALESLQTAQEIYENHFKNAALSVDPESNILIENAFIDSKEKLSNGDVEQASLNRQIIDKTIYKIAFMQMELAIEEENSENFLYWYNVLEKKFKVSEKNYQSNHWISEIKSDVSTLSENGPAILDELLNIFKVKTFEEIEEAIFALEEGDVKSAKKFAYEGLYYYRTFHPAVDAKLGEEPANELYHEMEEAIEVVMSDATPAEMKSKMKYIAAEVELIIREYEGGDTSEVGLGLSGIKDRLKLVDIEYVDAVDNGQIINQVEYDETVAFLEKARTIFHSVKPSLMELSESDTNSLESNFGEMESIVTAKGSTSDISILVAKSLNNIASLEEYAGGAVAIDVLQYFDEIERLLNEAKISYRNGETQLAHDLVSEAYLDNYEFVEGPLGEVDSELMLKIEIEMREELRSMIQSNVDADEIDDKIDGILVDLAEAKKVIPEFGTIASLILAVAIISIIAVSAKTRISLIPRI